MDVDTGTPVEVTSTAVQEVVTQDTAQLPYTPTPVDTVQPMTRRAARKQSQAVYDSSRFDEALKMSENSIRKGYDNESGLWTPHDSLEGGTGTLGYGHKITEDEMFTGKIVVGGKEVKFKKGLTEEQVNQLYKQDKQEKVTGLEKNWVGYSDLPQKYQDVLVNLSYNTGEVTQDNWPALYLAMQEGDDDLVRKEMVTTYKDKSGKRHKLTQRATDIADAVGLGIGEMTIRDTDLGSIPSNLELRGNKVNALTDRDLIRLQNAEPEEVEADPTAEVWDAATQRHWLHKAAQSYNALAIGEVDPQYTVTAEQLIPLQESKGYTEDDIAFLMGATSQSNQTSRQLLLDNQIRAKQILADAGVKGLVYEIGAGLIDPATLLLTVGTAGIGTLGKGGKVAQVASAFLLGASENMLIEAALKKYDTQRTYQDVLISGLAGGTLMAGMKGISLGLAARGIRKASQQADADVRVGAEQVQGKVAYQRADEQLAEVQPDPVARKIFLTEKEKIAKLREAEGIPTYSKKAVSKLESERRAISRSVDEVNVFLAETKRRVENTNRTKNQVAQDVKARESKLVELDNLLKRDTEIEGLLAKNEMGKDLSRGVVPEKLKASFMELSGTQRIAKPDELLDMHAKIDDTIDEADGLPATEGESVGAAKVDKATIERMHPLFDETSNLNVTKGINRVSDLGEAIPEVHSLPSSKLRSSFSDNFQRTKDAALRGINAVLNHNPSGHVDGHQSVAEIAETIYTRLMPKLNFRENDAVQEYLKSAGVKFWEFNKQAEVRHEFEKLVTLEMKSGTSAKYNPTGTPVQKAASARAEMYAEALKLNKKYSVRGFEEVAEDARYTPDVYSGKDMQSMIDKGYNIKQMEDTITEAYMTGKLAIKGNTARTIARATMQRTFKVSGNATDNKLVTDADFSRLSKELEDLLDEVEIKDFVDSLRLKAEEATLSPRTMAKLGLNVSHTHSSGLRMVDLLDTSSVQTNRYARNTAVNVGLSQNGFKSENQFMAVMDRAFNDRKEALLRYKEELNPKWEDEANDLANLRKDYEDTLKILKHEPLAGMDGSMSNLRRYTNLQRLRFTGLMSIPEYGNGLATFGVKSVLSNVLKTRWNPLKSKSIKDDAFMNDLGEAMGAYGHQEQIFNHQQFGGGDYFDNTKSLLSRALSATTDQMMTLNLMKTFQNGGEELMIRASVSNLIKAAKGGDLSDLHFLAKGGMSEVDIDTVAKALSNAPSDAKMFANLKEAIPFDTYTRFGTAMRNTIQQSMQRQIQGDLPKFYNSEMGRTLGQLMSFTIASYEKQLVKGIREDKARLATAMLYGTGLSLISHYAYTNLMASRMDNKNKRQYLKKHMSENGVVFGVLNRLPQISAPMTALGIGAYLAPSIKDTPSRSGIRPVSIAPAIDVVKDVGSLPLQAIGMLQGTSTEAQERRFMSTINPYYNNAAINTAIMAGNAVK